MKYCYKIENLFNVREEKLLSNNFKDYFSKAIKLMSKTRKKCSNNLFKTFKF